MSTRRASSGVNLRLVDADTVGIACDEMTDARHTSTAVWDAFGVTADVGALDAGHPGRVGRSGRSDFLTHPVFHEHRTETAMLRYLRRLADRDSRSTAR